MGSENWLAERNCLTDELYHQPYDIELYLKRATAYEHLGFPDLAAGDAHRALLLTDEARDESGEYHHKVLDALRLKLQSQKSNDPLNDQHRAFQDVETGIQEGHSDTVDNTKPILRPTQDEELSRKAHEYALQCYHLISRCLVKCGCLRSAFNFCTRGLSVFPDSELLQQRNEILLQHRKTLQQQIPTWDESAFDPKRDLPDKGSVRRELYPWNTYEPNRFSEDTLLFLNTEVSKVAPKCRVQAVSLPLLTEDGTHLGLSAGDNLPIVKQLGLFANEDILAEGLVLNESSILAVNNRLHYPLCDACSSELPDRAPQDTLLTCQHCDDTVFCSQSCFDLAMETYHPAICGSDVEAIGKDTDPLEAANALYLLLLGRVMAMAETQEAHPLDLKEVKYIWGDFITPDITYLHSESASAFSTARHLPFSFAYNVLLPLHLLEKMDVDIFASLPRYDTWILNTLYAKFRGTASARLSKNDGRPEVCAVHPIWSLANHSCDPNVTWEWGGNIMFRAKKERINWGLEGKREGGIKQGEEILSHYCDIQLGVKERREWAAGALGGMCLCQRCVWEEAHSE